MSTARWWTMCAWRSNGARPVEFYSRVGGNVPSAEEVLAFVRRIAAQQAVCEPEEVMVHA